MFSFRPPTPEALRLRTEQLQSAALTYVSPDGQPPPGFRTDAHRVSLGAGQSVFEAAGRAVRAWKMFPPAMATLSPRQLPIEVGQIVHVLFRAGPLWTANACRILRVIDSTGPVAQFGFTYGTLPGHVERGEETFLVEWNQASGEVTYSIRLFSRPAHWLIWLGYPYARQQQARFRRLSGQAMQQAVTLPPAGAIPSR